MSCVFEGVKNRHAFPEITPADPRWAERQPPLSQNNAVGDFKMQNMKLKAAGVGGCSEAPRPGDDREDRKKHPRHKKYHNSFM